MGQFLYQKFPMNSQCNCHRELFFVDVVLAYLFCQYLTHYRLAVIKQDIDYIHIHWRQFDS